MIWNRFVELYDPDIWVWEREQRAIKLACEELEGTFSCWVYNTDTSNAYLIRNGSTLFADHNTGDFSSAQHEGMKPLHDYAIYRVFYDADPIQKSKIEMVGYFDSHSPFFIL